MLRFTDDIALLANTDRELEEALNVTETVFIEYYIRWRDKVTNEKIVNLVKEKRSLYASIKRRRDRLIGHTLRHAGLEGIILEGIVFKIFFFQILPM